VLSRFDDGSRLCRTVWRAAFSRWLRIAAADCARPATAIRSRTWHDSVLETDNRNLTTKSPAGRSCGPRQQMVPSPCRERRYPDHAPSPETYWLHSTDIFLREHQCHCGAQQFLVQRGRLGAAITARYWFLWVRCPTGNCRSSVDQIIGEREY
jgi:hypothetical protein